MSEDDAEMDVWQPGAQNELIKYLYVFERDTKYLHMFDLQSRVLEKKLLNIQAPFPHNF